MRTRLPSERRRMIQGLLILTLLAWATQTLLSQWGFGDEISRAQLPTMSEMKFMPSAFHSATVELKSEATIIGPEIRLKQIARWSSSDAPLMQPSAELVVARFEKGKTRQVISVHDLKATLEAAGVNLATVTFCGAIACSVTRSDGPSGAPLPPDMLDPEAPVPPTRMPTASAIIPPLAAGQSQASSHPPRTLRDILLADLVDRLAVPADSLQVQFSGNDQKLANLSEPYFQFEIEPQRLRRLGSITWNVKIKAATGQQATHVTADVRMWWDELVTTRPLAFRQIIREEDVMQRRVLVDRLPDDAPLTKEQVIGHQAARDLSPGTVLVGRMIEAVEMARIGQLITVMVELGRVHVTWVAEAREAGALGQTIRVRKPGTREEFSVMLTGPQQAKLVGAVPGAARPGFASLH